MIDWKTIVGVCGGIFALMGFIPYIVTICQGKTSPNRASWSIWASLGIVLAVSNFEEGARDTMPLLIAYAICQITIALLSFKYGEGGWNTFDRTCLLGALISIILWQIYDSPLIAITISIAIDSLGALPTIKKSYLEPDKEDFFSWLMFWIAGTCNILTLTELSAIAAQPLYLFSFNSIVITLLLLPRLQSKRKSSRAK